MPLPAVSLEPPRRTTWQIKVSTLCNLRCRYCYEWERLDDARRMSLPGWRRLLEVIREHRRQRLREEGEDLVTTIVWHGGEPLLQPPAYVRAVLALQRDVLGIESAGIRNAVQTNLTRAGETLSVMIDAGFLLSVSADFAAGVRVDAAGCDSGARVTAHMERLAGTSASWGVALVLGHHNRVRLREIHDALRSMGAAWLRIHPMYAPPSGAPGHALQLTDDEVFSALRGLFEHWLENDARLPVHPLTRIVRTVLRRRAGIVGASGDRRDHVRFVVDPDGTLTEEGGTATPTATLGNVFGSSIQSILENIGRRGPDRLARLHGRHCGGCAFVGACGGRPVLEHPAPLPAGPCPNESRLCQWAEDFIPAA